MGARKWTNNTAELTAIGQALLAASIALPREVTIFYDSTYAHNAVAKINAPLRRDSPNTAMVTTIRRIRLHLEKQGTRINWRHVKGHSREKGGPIRQPARALHTDEVPIEIKLDEIVLVPDLSLIHI